LSQKVVSGITKFQLDSYIVALEGWRRGLTLKWYKDESDMCKLDRLRSSTQGKFFSLTSDKRTHYFFRSRGDQVSNRDVRICQNKDKTKAYLAKKNVPIPAGGIFQATDDDKIVQYAKKIGFPVVIKPISGSMGRGVYTDIKDEDALIEILDNLRSTLKYSEYMIEKHYPGNEYRVYVVGDHVAGAINRLPANITGDGKNDVQTLIKLKNRERKKNPYLARKPIKVDHEVRQSLKNAGYDLKSIPKKQETIFLRNKSNLSAGGDPIAAELSEEVQQVAVNALKALPSIPHGGVDVIVDPTDKTKCVVLEINATAEISFHSFPLEGKPQDIPGAIMDYYLPETKEKYKTNFYFDYKSILEPLKTWSTDVIQVAHPPLGQLYGKKYIAHGKVVKVGYMNKIRRQALRRNLHGFSKKTGENTIEVTIIGTDKQEVDRFYEICKKGSKKSKVKTVEQEEIDVN